MSLLGRRGFESFVVKLPAVTLVEQWDSLVAKVGGKVFALAAAGGGSIAFKVSETAFEGLTGLEGIAQAPYFAKGQWVSVSKGADVSEADLKAYVREAHRNHRQQADPQAAGRTRRRRACCGAPAQEHDLEHLRLKQRCDPARDAEDHRLMHQVDQEAPAAEEPEARARRTGETTGGKPIPGG